MNKLTMVILSTQAVLKLLNPFSHINAIWRLCSSWLFENMVTKEESAQNKQFLLMSLCFQIYSIIVLSFKGSFQICSGYVFKVVCCRFDVCFQSRLLQIWCMWERVNACQYPFLTCWRICSRWLLKILWKKKKLLKMSNFSLCHNVFNSI